MSPPDRRLTREFRGIEEPWPGGRSRCHGLRFRRGAAPHGRGEGLRRAHHARGAAGDARQGQDRPHGGLPRALRPGDPRGRLQHPQRRPAQTLRERQTARLRLRDPRRRPLPRQLLLPARLGQRRLPPRPAGHPLARLARGAAGAARALRQTARLRPRHRPDRLGQEHDPGGDDRRDQRREARTTSSRSRTRSSSCTSTNARSSTSARSAPTRPTSPSACAPPCARTPTSSWSARCATWRRSPPR